MNPEARYFLFGLVLGALQGGMLFWFLCERARKRAAKEARARYLAKRDELGMKSVPPGLVPVLQHAAASVSLSLEPDNRAKPVGSFVAASLLEAYSKGAHDFRMAILRQEALPADVMDGVCTSAMAQVASGLPEAAPAPWPGWADDK